MLRCYVSVKFWDLKMGGLLLLPKQHVPKAGASLVLEDGWMFNRISWGTPSTKKKECSWLLVEHGIPKNSYCWLTSDKHFFLTHKNGAATSLIPTPMHLRLFGMARRGQRLRPSQGAATKELPRCWTETQVRFIGRSWRVHGSSWSWRVFIISWLLSLR